MQISLLYLFGILSGIFAIVYVLAGSFEREYRVICFTLAFLSTMACLVTLGMITST